MLLFIQPSNVKPSSPPISYYYSIGSLYIYILHRIVQKITIIFAYDVLSKGSLFFRDP